MSETSVDVQLTPEPPVSTTAPEATATLPVSDTALSTTATPSAPASPTPGAAARVSPLLSIDLVRGCEGREPSAQGPQVGEPAIEFALLDVDGNPYILSELLQEKPVILIFGSFT